MRRNILLLFGECLRVTLILLHIGLFFLLLLLILIHWIILFDIWRLFLWQFFICIIINSNFLRRRGVRLIKRNIHGFFNNQCSFIIHSISFACIRISKKNTNIRFWIKFTKIIFYIQYKTFAYKNFK